MRTSCLPRSGSCVVEILEARIAPASHEWTGLGANNLWSNPANWNGGSPAADLSGDIDLIFHTNLATAKQLVTVNDIPGLVVDSITFDANTGTNAVGGIASKGYTLNGMPLTINVGAGGGAGIDIAPGVTDATKGLTNTINLRLILNTFDATFQVRDPFATLVLNGDVSLDGKTLTLDVAHATNKTPLVINGDIKTGNLIKVSAGTAQLTGDNSHTNTTVNGGILVVKSDLGLGLPNAGTVTVNDPARVILRDGVTVEKPQLTLNSNPVGGGLGADGNTTNTFRGSLVLQAGSGGVALGSGVGPAEAKTRLIIDGVVSGATSTLSFNGAGVVEFTQNNTYSGLTNLNGNNGFGALQINTPGGLGASGGGNEIQLNRNGAGPTGTALWLNFDGTLNESIGFAGTGIESTGAIRVLGDHVVTLTGNVTLTAGAPWFIGVDEEGGVLTLTGVIDSQGFTRGLTKVGDGMLVIGGASANTWVGGISVAFGTLRVTNTTATPLGTSAGLVAIHNDSTLGLFPGVVIPNTVQLGVNTEVSGAGTISGTILHSSLKLAANGKSGTYVDEDGDLVKITSSKGRLWEQDFLFKFATDGHQQLQLLTIDAADAKTAIKIDSKAQAGGDGFTKVGFINAAGVALGNVTIDGDLGRINAAGLGTLTVDSMGVYGTATQAAGGSLINTIIGDLGGLNVKTTFTNELLTTSGRIGSVKIGGSWLNGRIGAGADIGAVTVGGDFYGTDSANPAILSAFGKAVAPKSGTDLAIASIKVGGNVGFANIFAGFSVGLTGTNADASVGSVTVNGSWFASNLLAGVRPGTDALRGTADDEKLSGGGVRDHAAIFSKIGAIVIKGTADGTAGAGDHFGIRAEQVASATIGTGASKVKLAFTAGPRGPSDFHIVGAFGDLGIGEIIV